MLTNNMNLNQMVRFEPNSQDMAMLDLDIVVYCKVSIISLNKQDNYDFIKIVFQDEDFPIFFKNYSKTIFYDFDATHTDQAKFISIFELYSVFNYHNTFEYLQRLLESYNHTADIIIDLFTHDDKKYRLSNLDGIVKIEELNNQL